MVMLEKEMKDSVLDDIEYNRYILESKFKNSEISLSQYSQGLIKLTYDLAYMGLPDDALLMLILIPEEYFDKPIFDDFDKNEELQRKCLFIFSVLDFANFISYDIDATQSVAQA